MTTDSEKIQDSVWEQAKAHWEFLEDFIHEVREVGAVKGELDGHAIELIKYGFLLAYPHAYKHGFKDGREREKHD
jgi:hypothetical protein